MVVYRGGKSVAGPASPTILFLELLGPVELTQELTGWQYALSWPLWL